MATQAQIDANRRNAAKSTGPRTDAGKQVVANNALKHGLFSAEALIAGEDAETFAEFADEIRLHLEEDERSLASVAVVERIILLRWKIRRIPRLEALAMKKLVDQFGDGDEAMLAGLTGDSDTATLAKLQQYEVRLNRELRSCMNEFRKEYQYRNREDCHRSWVDGYNRGVDDQALDLQQRRTIPQKGMPGPRYQPVDMPVSERPWAVDEDSAEQTQSADGEASAPSPGTPGGDEGSVETGQSPAIAEEPSPYPLPEYRERDKSREMSPDVAACPVETPAAEQSQFEGEGSVAELTEVRKEVAA
jgi:hypothetical protein